MYNSEYILIYKDELLDWPFQEAGAWHLWSFLRLKAATADTIQRIGSSNTIGIVKFGQFLTSKRYLSEQLHISSRRIDYLLGCFVQAKYIEVLEDSNSIRITVRDFERFCPPINYVPATSWIMRSEAGENDLFYNGDEASDSTIDEDSNVNQIATPIEPSVSQQVMYQVPQDMPQPVSQTTTSTQPEASKKSPESPIVVEEDKKKENNNINSTTSTSKGKEDFFERLKNSPAELEVVRTQMEVPTIDKVIEQLSVFELYVGETKQHKSYGDFVSHFTSWYRKYSARKSNKSSAPKDGSNQAAHYEKRKNWRDNLGVVSNAVTADDYDEPI